MSFNPLPSRRNRNAQPEPEVEPVEALTVIDGGAEAPDETAATRVIDVAAEEGPRGDAADAVTETPRPAASDLDKSWWRSVPGFGGKKAPRDQVWSVPSGPGAGDPRAYRLAEPDAPAATSELYVPAGPAVGRSVTEPQTAEQVKAALFGVPTSGELVADEVTAWFGDHKVLDRVSLTMDAGKVTALIGPSGCGKSTFLRILNRMHEQVPTASLAGEVRLDGSDIYGRGEKVTAVRARIGMIFQKPNPFPAKSIYDNVISGLALMGVRASRAQKDALVEDCLRKAALWDEVKDRLEAPGGGLSGGQQQRLCIARSLAVSPQVLLMDEPCSALDPTSTRRVEETIASLRDQVTIVIVTHNMQQAARVSDQCAFFLAAQGEPGGIVEYGDTSAMFEKPQDPRTLDYVNGRFG
jgi:phosphate transport system ATP-binding protein